MLKKLLVVFALCFVAVRPVAAEPSVQQLDGFAKIDWTHHVYVATGEGAMPSSEEEPNRARAYLKARGYARMAAIANLLMAIEGTAISYEASGKDYMADETIRQRVEGFVNNVELVSERRKQVEGHTVVIAEVRVPMFGANAPGSIFLKKMAEDHKALAASESQPPTEGAQPGVEVVLQPDAKPTAESVIACAADSPASAKPSAPGTPYTSLIVDTTGYKLDRCMSPKIRRADGSEVWGTVKADYDFIQEEGIVVYATSLEAAKKSHRCGSNPLIITAIGRAGGKFHSDAVISDEDAELLTSENAKSKFLDKCNVIFVKDGRL